MWCSRGCPVPPELLATVHSVQGWPCSGLWARAPGLVPGMSGEAVGVTVMWRSRCHSCSGVTGLEYLTLVICVNLYRFLGAGPLVVVLLWLSVGRPQLPDWSLWNRVAAELSLALGTGCRPDL